MGIMDFQSSEPQIYVRASEGSDIWPFQLWCRPKL